MIRNVFITLCPPVVLWRLEIGGGSDPEGNEDGRESGERERLTSHSRSGRAGASVEKRGKRGRATRKEEQRGKRDEERSGRGRVRNGGRRAHSTFRLPTMSTPPVPVHWCHLFFFRSTWRLSGQSELHHPTYSHTRALQTRHSLYRVISRRDNVELGLPRRNALFATAVCVCPQEFVLLIAGRVTRVRPRVGRLVRNPLDQGRSARRTRPVRTQPGELPRRPTRRRRPRLVDPAQRRL